MTPDDLISMHATCENAIGDMSLLGNTSGIPSIVDNQLAALRQNISALAVVQRDLLKAMLDK